jgi:hypothetical protein
LRDFLPAGVLAEDFLAVLEEVLADVFVALFLLAAGAAFWIFVELAAVGFFFGVFLAGELLTAAVLLFDEVFFLEAAVACAGLAGTPSRANEAVSRTRSAARTIFITSCSSCFAERLLSVVYRNNSR